MKKLLIALTLILFSVEAYSQTNPIGGLKGDIAAFNFYRKTVLGAIANDTTGFLALDNPLSLSLWAKSTDSIQFAVWYQLKQSSVGESTAWTIANDTIDLRYAGGVHDTLITNIPYTSVIGYDQMRIYLDVIAATTDTSAGGAIFNLFLTHKK